MNYTFDADTGDKKQWRKISRKYDSNPENTLEIILGKVLLIGVSHPNFKCTKCPLNLSTTIQKRSYSHFMISEMGSIPIILYLRTAGLKLEALANRLLIFSDFDCRKPLEYPVSLWCDRKEYYSHASSLLQSIQPNLRIKSAHHRFLKTAFDKDAIPFAYWDSERVGKGSHLHKIKEIAQKGNVMILLWIGSANPEPYQICESGYYFSLDFPLTVILFTCQKDLNSFQMVVLQYLFQNWSKFKDSSHPLDILSDVPGIVYNPIPALHKQLKKRSY